MIDEIEANLDDLHYLDAIFDKAFRSITIKLGKFNDLLCNSHLDERFIYF